MDEGGDDDDEDREVEEEEEKAAAEEEEEERERKSRRDVSGKRKQREKKGGSSTTLGRQGRRSQGARGMMNIKAGQAVRVDSTLSARGAPRAKKELSDQYFLCENHGRGG